MSSENLQKVNGKIAEQSIPKLQSVNPEAIQWIQQSYGLHWNYIFSTGDSFWDTIGEWRVDFSFQY